MKKINDNEKKFLDELELNEDVAKLYYDHGFMTKYDEKLKRLIELNDTIRQMAKNIEIDYGDAISLHSMVQLLFHSVEGQELNALMKFQREIKINNIVYDKFQPEKIEGFVDMLIDETYKKELNGYFVCFFLEGVLCFAKQKEAVISD